MELQKEWKLHHNYVEQSKLNISLFEEKKAVVDKGTKLENAIIGLLMKIKETEMARAMADELEALLKEEVDRLCVTLKKESEAFLVDNFEFRKDVNANFIYYMAFSEAI